MSDTEKPIHSFVPVADEVPWWTEIENLKRERDEAREQVKDLAAEVHQLECKVDALQEQLNAAIMLGKMQERRHERELEDLIATAKAVIDRWETPFWKEVAHTGAYIAALRKAVEIAEGGHL